MLFVEMKPHQTEPDPPLRLASQAAHPDEPSPSVVVVSVRVPADLRDKYVAWANDCKVSLSDILRGILDWAIIHRPDWQLNPQRDWEDCTDPDEMAQAIQPCKPNTPIHRALTGVFVGVYSIMYDARCDHEGKAEMVRLELRSYASGECDWKNSLNAMQDLYNFWRKLSVPGSDESRQHPGSIMFILQPLMMLASHGLPAALSSVPFCTVGLEHPPVLRSSLSETERQKIEDGGRKTRAQVCDAIRARFPMAPAGFVDRSRQKGQLSP